MLILRPDGFQLNGPVFLQEGGVEVNFPAAFYLLSLRLLHLPR
jgi:hypothetical protein